MPRLGGTAAGSVPRCRSSDGPWAYEGGRRLPSVALTLVAKRLVLMTGLGRAIIAGMKKGKISLSVSLFRRTRHQRRSSTHTGT
jgi:hypothetical protein